MSEGPYLRWRFSPDGREHDVELARSHLALQLSYQRRGEQDLAFVAPVACQSAASAGDVHAYAKDEVARWNSALALADPDFEPLRAGGVVHEIDAAGNKIDGTTFLEGKGAVISLRNGVATVLVDGQPVSRPLAQRALGLMRESEDFDSALRLLAVAGQDFRLLYVVMEFIRDGIGCGVEKKERWARLEAKGWVLAADLHRFRRTANGLYRHKPEPVEDPMSAAEASVLVRRLLRCWLNENKPR